MEIVKIGNAELYLADCMEALNGIPDACISAVIIDPPFSGNVSKSKAGEDGRFQNSHIMFDDMTERAFYKFVKPILLECYRVLAEGGHIYCFSDWKQLRNMMDCVELSSLKICNLVCWDKMSFGLGAGYRRQEEYIIVGSKGLPKTFNLKNVGTVLKFKRVSTNSRQHPHEKPVDLIECLIDNSTFTGETVLDCFMGSGSTGVAAINKGRKFIGMEIDHSHFATSCSRIELAQKQGDMFVEPAPAKAEQASLL